MSGTVMMQSHPKDGVSSDHELMQGHDRCSRSARYDLQLRLTAARSVQRRVTVQELTPQRQAYSTVSSQRRHSQQTLAPDRTFIPTSAAHACTYSTSPATLSFSPQARFAYLSRPDLWPLALLASLHAPCMNSSAPAVTSSKDPTKPVLCQLGLLPSSRVFSSAATFLASMIPRISSFPDDSTRTALPDGTFAPVASSERQDAEASR
eukprot:764248-Hanusia_phi.AAC.2